MPRKLIRYRVHKEGEHKGKTEIYRPEPNEEGFYVLGDPTHGNVKHHREHAVYTFDRSTAERLVELGFHLRMKGELTGQVNLISPSSIE
ncbi:MAG: hypothetical protein ABF759_12690 [Acetobacter malorum]|uniref:hypothetical protein n=1 Tax=Acetobacter malorum TaxID=178901 RepID=UPI0039E8F8B3